MSKFTLDKIKVALDKLPKEFTDKVAKVGWFEDAQYEDGTPVASIAIQNEFGAPAKRIPPRPFMRPTIVEKRDAWVKIMADGVRATLNGGISGEIVLQGVGLQAQGDVQKTITLVMTPPLSPKTIAARRAKYKTGRVTASLTKPLIDSGVMMASITHVVGKAEND